MNHDAPLKSVLSPPRSWQEELAESYSSVEDLEGAALLTSDEAVRLRAVGERFRVRLPRYYAALMDHSPEGRDRCPIRKQALPDLGEEDPRLPAWAEEWSELAFGSRTPWRADAIGDLEKIAAPRLTHRYGNRAILHLSSLCALYCRFCFRKSHLNDAERPLYAGSLEPALRYLASHPEIRELILTGGDPLSTPDAWLEKFFNQLAEIRHLNLVRLHSRMAVTLPSRLTPSLARLLGSQPFSTALVSHFNHPRELALQAREALWHFKRQGVALYNQSVLLAGVNDDADVLYELFQRLYEWGVTPYYLHHPDWTPGTFHFRLPISRGRAMMAKLAGRLSGPAMPQYVLDIPGGGGKVLLAADDRARLRETRSGGGLGGALYEISPPQTRSNSIEKVLYAEFWQI